MMWGGKHFLFALCLGFTLGIGSASAANVGDEMYQEFEKAGAFYDDPELVAYVRRIGERLLAQSSMADKPFKFNVIDSPDINAFATPGYYVYINRGLIAYLNNEAELAGVLGHEIAHITRKHHRRHGVVHRANGGGSPTRSRLPRSLRWCRIRRWTR